MGKVIPLKDLLPVIRASDYDKDIDEALKMPEDSALLVDFTGRRFDSANIGIRQRVERRGLTGKLHVEVRTDKQNQKGIYLMHGPGRIRASRQKPKK